MKKNVFSLLLLLAVAALPACKQGEQAEEVNEPIEGGDVDVSKLDNKTERCWHLTLSAFGYTQDVYEWGTEYAVVSAYEAASKNIGYQYSYQKTDASDENACRELNSSPDDIFSDIDAGEVNRACYKIDITYKGGSSTTTYYWLTPDLLEEYLTMLKTYVSDYMSVKTEKVEGVDEAACNKLDDETGTYSGW